MNNQSLIPSTDVIQLTLTPKMTTAEVVETSVTVNNTSIQDYVHQDDHAQSIYEMTAAAGPSCSKGKILNQVSISFVQNHFLE